MNHIEDEFQCKIIDVIAEGYFGKVYKVQSMNTHVDLAVKAQKNKETFEAEC